MAEIITMPKLGFDMKEGTFAAWVKKVGESITSGEVIAEVETDKATVEVETYTTGVLLHVMAEPGDILEVGAPIAIIGAAGEDISGLLGGAVPAKKQVEEATAVGELQAPVSAAPLQPAPPTVEQDHNGHLPGGVKASPVARRIAAEQGIDLRQVVGTGPGGRIVKRDLEGAKPLEVEIKPPSGVEPPIRAAEISLGGPPSYPIMTDIPHEVIPISRLRATIARRMVESKQFVPHFTVTMAMDTSALLELRAQINAKLEDDEKITINDLIVKATALTLRRFPNLNTHYHGETLIRYQAINIGIAVALPNGGLINVVARNADTVALSALAKKNKQMIASAREGKVKPEDIEGSTFTVSNLGAYGVEHFTAIINPPEAGILAIGASQKVPIVGADGQLTVGNIMKATISVDHRVSDGAEGADFMKAFKELIEDPMRLLI